MRRPSASTACSRCTAARTSTWAWKAYSSFTDNGASHILHHPLPLRPPRHYPAVAGHQFRIVLWPKEGRQGASRPVPEPQAGIHGRRRRLAGVRAGPAGSRMAREDEYRPRDSSFNVRRAVEEWVRSGRVLIGLRGQRGNARSLGRACRGDTVRVRLRLSSRGGCAQGRGGDRGACALPRSN